MQCISRAASMKMNREFFLNRIFIQQKCWSRNDENTAWLPAYPFFFDSTDWKIHQDVIANNFLFQHGHKS